jgi:hypothetical protein
MTGGFVGDGWLRRFLILIAVLVLPALGGIIAASGPARADGGPLPPPNGGRQSGHAVTKKHPPKPPVAKAKVKSKPDCVKTPDHPACKPDCAKNPGHPLCKKEHPKVPEQKVCTSDCGGSPLAAQSSGGGSGTSSPCTGCKVTEAAKPKTKLKPKQPVPVVHRPPSPKPPTRKVPPSVSPPPAPPPPCLPPACTPPALAPPPHPLPLTGTGPLAPVAAAAGALAAGGTVLLLVGHRCRRRQV